MEKLDKARWIASYPKSGSTWVRMFLEAYITGSLDINNQRTSRGDTIAMEYQQAATIPIDNMSEEVLLQYRNSALMNTMLRHLPNTMYFKTHNAQIAVHGIHLIPPVISDSALYLVRDPRDIAPSWAAHMGKTMDEIVYQMSEPSTILSSDNSLKHYVGSWSTHVKSWENGIKTCRIRYEDLLENPEGGFKVILEHFKIKLNSRRLGKALRLCELENLKSKERKYGFKEKLRDNAPEFFGGERQKLTPKQRAKIELDHGEIMTQLGYEVNNYGSNDKVRQLSTAVNGSKS